MLCCVVLCCVVLRCVVLCCVVCCLCVTCSVALVGVSVVEEGVCGGDGDVKPRTLDERQGAPFLARRKQQHTQKNAPGKSGSSHSHRCVERWFLLLFVSISAGPSQTHLRRTHAQKRTRSKTQTPTSSGSVADSPPPWLETALMSGSSCVLVAAAVVAATSFGGVFL